MHAYTKILRIALLLFLFVQTSVVLAQETTDQTVTGTIINSSTGLALAGIHVAVPDYSSTATNDSGVFTIKVPSYKVTLIVSGKDFQSKEVALKGRNSVSIKLYEETFNSVYDAVTLPYGEKYKSQTVHSVDKVNGSWTNPYASTESMLQGKIVGLNTIFRSGTPGIGANMFLRGYSSFYGTNQPLIVIDGMIYDYQNYSPSQIDGYVSDPLSLIDVKDIDNITVLKDAVSLYGSKAANGVILINTVHAKESATHIDFYVQGGVNYTPKNIPVMNASDFRVYLTDQFKSQGYTNDQIFAQPYMNNTNGSANYIKYNNNTNWQNEVFNQSNNQNYYLRVTGGDEVAKYGLSVGYLNNAGIIKNTDFTRYNIRFNADVLATSRFTINTNLGFTWSEHNLKNDGYSPKTGPVYLSLVKSPFFSPNVLDADGVATQNLEDVDSLKIGNPLALLSNENMFARNKAYRFSGSVKLAYKLGKFMNLSSLLGLTYDKNDENIFIPDKGTIPDTLSTALANNTVKSNIQRFETIYSDTRLNFTRNYNRSHYLSVDLGVRYSTNKTRDDISLAYNTPTDALKYLDAGNSLLDRTDGSAGNWKWMTFYSGIDYSFLKKYFVSFNISTDGSSRFGIDAKGISLFSHKFGLFPSIGAAWLISSENCMAKYTFIDLLKLRATYGITGNDDIGNYGDSKYYTSQRFIGFTGLIQGNLSNTHIQWETNRKLNLGLDLALFNERVQFSIDYYHHNIDKMLTFNPFNPLSGFKYVLLNNGEVKNDGVEFMINGRVLNGTLKWDLGFGMAQNINKIVSLPGGEFITNLGGASVLSREGQPMGVFYGYKTVGVFATETEAMQSGLTNRLSNDQTVAFHAGDVHFVDANGDKIIDEKDKQIIGNPNPWFTGMITNHFAWKRISVDALLTFSYSYKVYNQLRSKLEAMSGYENQTTAVLNRWRTEGQITSIPKATYGDPMGNSRFSDRWIEDGSYVKLKTLSISYEIPIKPGFFRNAMIYVAGNNLLAVSKYLGYDPEFSMASGSLSQGIDCGLTPQFRSVYVGLKIGL